MVMIMTRVTILKRPWQFTNSAFDDRSREKNQENETFHLLTTPNSQILHSLHSLHSRYRYQYQSREQDHHSGVKVLKRLLIKCRKSLLNSCALPSPTSSPARLLRTMRKASPWPNLIETNVKRVANTTDSVRRIRTKIPILVSARFSRPLEVTVHVLLPLFATRRSKQ